MRVRALQPVATTLLSLPPALRFLLGAAVWIVVLFGLMRLSWVQQNLLLPFAGLQLDFACALTGAPKNSVIVNESCTGSDALALCLGAILAFPTTWRRRLAGCALGFVVISLLNTVRIGSLALIVDQVDLFRLLHLYVWPAVLILAAAGYVVTWMRWATREPPPATSASRPALHYEPAAIWRFLGLATILVGLYYAALPALLRSDWILAAARSSARVAGWLLNGIGVEAQVFDSLLRTEQGRWIISGECVATPLFPVYLAGVILFAGSARSRLLALLGAVPLFLALATARLLVVALPPSLIGSPFVAVHAFYQILAALVVVAIAAHLATDPGRTGRGWRAVGAVAVGTALAVTIQAAAQSRLEAGLGWADPQGALVLLPAFQIGFFAALLWAVGWSRFTGRRVALACATLLASQVALVAVLAAARQLSVEIHVVVIRCAALAIPRLLVWALSRLSPPESNEPQPVPQP